MPSYCSVCNHICGTGYVFEYLLLLFQVTYPLSCSENNNVVIKVVAKGHEGLGELKILQILNAKPLKSNPSNATIPIVEFLCYDDWHFVVMLFCDGSDKIPFLNAMECLEFTKQVLLVSLVHLPYYVIHVCLT
jgi:hypothetical protein